MALALKSRICLYEGTWRKYHGLDGSEEWLRACVAASEELMGDSPYSLVSTAGEETTNYSKVFKSEEPQYTEVILANEFNATLNRFHDASWYYASGSYGQRNSGPKAFVNMYLNLDGTRFTDKDGYNKTRSRTSSPAATTACARPSSRPTTSRRSAARRPTNSQRSSPA